MQAVRVHEGGELRSRDGAGPEPGPGEVVVELRTAALNRRDLLVRSGTYPFPLPLVPGSDGAGVRRDTGEEVVIYPALDWGEREEAYGPDFQILGGPRDGTFAELVVVPEANVFPKPAQPELGGGCGAAARRPDGLSGAVLARPAACADETVLVLGAGSGVSTFAVQLAAQAGARVLVTSSSDEKIERSRALGAEAGVNYASEDWVGWVKERGGADLVVDSVGSTWPQSLECLRPGGRLVVFGATGGTEVELPVRPVLLVAALAARDDDGQPRRLRRPPGRVQSAAPGRPVVDSVRPLAEAPAALDDARERVALRQAGAHMQLSVSEWGTGGRRAGDLPARRDRPRAAFPRAGRGAARRPSRGRRRLPRHGRSSWDPPWGVEQHVADLVETADALGLSGAAWVGHSFGGKLVAEVAARHPDRVERAVLLDPALHIDPAVAGERAELVRGDVSFASPDEAIDTRLSDGSLFTTPREVLEEEAREHLVEGPTGASAGSGARRRSSSPGARWPRRRRPWPRCPTLVVVGERSWIPVGVPRKGTVTSVSVPGGHSVLWDDFDATADAIARFLA